MVNKERLDILLQEVIQEARALKIPVSSTIEKNVIVNGRPKKRFGCCRKSRNGFEIEVSRFLLDEAGRSEKIVKGVLAHEVLHTCRDCYEHGMLWKSYAGQMGSGIWLSDQEGQFLCRNGNGGQRRKTGREPAYPLHYPVQKMRQTVPSAEVHLRHAEDRCISLSVQEKLEVFRIF